MRSIPLHSNQIQRRPVYSSKFSICEKPNKLIRNFSIQCNYKKTIVLAMIICYLCNEDIKHHLNMESSKVCFVCKVSSIVPLSFCK